MPDEPEVHGLLAMMLLLDARREARFRDGELVLLADQDRSLWDAARIAAGRAALDRALALRGRGPYVIQAAIASLHADEPRDWPQIAALYGELARLTGSPVVELNRAVAVAEAEGPEAGLDDRRRASTSTATSTCTRPAASCCAGSAAPTRPARPSGGRWSWPRTTPSGVCSSAGCCRRARVGAGMETRREFLKKAGVVGGAAALAGPLAACGATSSAAKERHRVAIVGAGLAGLSCAHRLRQRGVEAAVYEARPDRVGGRCWSAHGFAEGQVGEHGGELIDADHSRIRALARELGLRLEDRLAAARRHPGAESRLFLDGALRDEDAVFSGYRAFKRSLRRVSEEELDRHTARELLDRGVPGGGESLMGQAMRGFIASEFGLDAERLSAASLSYLREVPGLAAAESSLERYHVRAATTRCRTGWRNGSAAQRCGSTRRSRRFRRRGDRSYGMRFDGARQEVVADRSCWRSRSRP